MNLPVKLVQHKGGCVKCHEADSILDLCRIGRRLYLSWLAALPEEGQMMALFAMPESERNKVKDLAGLDHLTIGEQPS